MQSALGANRRLLGTDATVSRRWNWRTVNLPWAKASPALRWHLPRTRIGAFVVVMVLVFMNCVRRASSNP
ncbi:MAG: hypothetical protein P1V81_02910 [Planctomycetota bacterium]|nr:hypothetical protein [Planctomycetota bacterium]